MGAALGLIAGLGQAAQGLPQGLNTAQQEEDKTRALAQQQRQFEDAKFVDVPRGMLPTDTQATIGTAPTMRVATALAPILAGRAEKERQLEQEKLQGANIGGKIRQLGPEFQTLADALESGAGANPQTITALEGVMKLQQAKADRGRGQAILSQIFPGLQMPGTTAPVGQPPAAAPGAPKFQPAGLDPNAPPEFSAPSATEPDPLAAIKARQQAEREQALSSLNTQLGASGRPPFQQPAGGGPSPQPEPPVKPAGPNLPPGVTAKFDPLTGHMTFDMKGPTENKAIYTREDIEDQIKLEDAQRAKPYSPLEKRQRYNDLARQIQLAAGGEIRGAGTGLTPPAAGSGMPAAAPLAERAAKPEAAEVEKVAGMQDFISQARETAATLRKVLPSTYARASFAARQVAQGIPFAQAYASLSPEEQAIASKMGDLRLTWERAKAGVRGAASPQMNIIFQKIMGSPSSATAPEALEALAQQTEGELKNFQQTMQQSGRTAIGPQGVGGIPPVTVKPPSGGEVLSRRDPLYQKARAKGMSDQQIQQKYGVQVTD